VGSYGRVFLRCFGQKETDAKIKDVCVRFPEYDYLLTIPGFGPDISSKVVAAIGNLFRFNSLSQVLKMAGMDLNEEKRSVLYASGVLIRPISR
jgi:hypothetical protein